MIQFKKKQTAGLAKVAEGLEFKNPQTRADKAVDDLMKKKVINKRARTRALNLFMMMNKDLTPKYKNREIINELIKKRFINKSQRDFYDKKLSRWIVLYRWKYHREQVKEMALEIAARGFNFNMAVEISTKKLLRTLKMDSELFGPAEEGMRIISEKAKVLAYLARDALIMHKLTSEVTRNLAQNTIDGRVLDARDKLQMSSAEAHQLRESAHKVLAQMAGMSTSSSPQLVINNTVKTEENCGGELPSKLTDDQVLMIMSNTDEHNQMVKMGGGNTRGYVIQKAPNNKDFDKFSNARYEDAIIVSKEGSDKDGEG